MGHLDTVIAHDRHRPRSREGDKLLGSGTVDMKGGVVLALGVLRALAAPERRASFAEAALLLVQDEEWRVGRFGHVERFAGFDVCLCFEAGQLTADGGDAVDRQAQGGGHAAGPRARALVALRLGARPGRATRCSRSPPPRRPVGERTTRAATCG